MKNLVYILVVFGVIVVGSCDKVKNPYPPAYNTELDTTIYPGIWNDYILNEWPDFSTLPNDDPQRNVLIEDYTGHNCSFCPAAGDIAHGIHEANPTRVFVSSIHASNTTDGLSSFQTLNIGQGYTIDFTNPVGLEYGSYFGTVLVSSGFFGNPGGTINRQNEAGEYFPGTGTWASKANQEMASSLKVAIKAKLNYYEMPNHGFFLHTEVEKLDATVTNDLAMVVYMIEDSLVGPQNVDNTFTPDYIHRDIFRGTVDNQVFGRVLTDEMIEGGKYYLDYSGIIPDQLRPVGQTPTIHNADNMHLLIYVYDKVTLEIYQVIKKKFIP